MSENDREHDFEPVHGLPGDLPKGEYLLWQGSPEPWALARRVFHVPVVAIYFGVLMAIRIGEQIAAGATIVETLTAAAQVLPIAALGLGLLAGLAWLNAKTSVYTITSKRVVMRFGVALTKAINIPFSVIETAALQTHKDGTGDLALVIRKPNKIAFLNLWPHARPTRLANPEPTFRGIANAAAVAPILARAMTGDIDPSMAIEPVKAIVGKRNKNGEAAPSTPAMA